MMLQWTKGTETFVNDVPSKAILIEEGTTNLLTANQSSVETDTTGFAPRGAATITKDSTYAVHGNSSLKVVTSNVASSEGFYTTNTNVTAGTTYTASVYLRGTGTVGVVIVNQNNVGLNTVNVTLNDTWQRFAVSAMAQSEDTSFSIHVRTNTQQAATFYADCLQLE